MEQVALNNTSDGRRGLGIFVQRPYGNFRDDKSTVRVPLSRNSSLKTTPVILVESGGGLSTELPSARLRIRPLAQVRSRNKSPRRVKVCGKWQPKEFSEQSA